MTLLKEVRSGLVTTRSVEVLLGNAPLLLWEMSCFSQRDVNGHGSSRKPGVKNFVYYFTDLQLGDLGGEGFRTVSNMY